LYKINITVQENQYIKSDKRTLFYIYSLNYAWSILEFVLHFAPVDNMPETAANDGDVINTNNIMELKQKKYSGNAFKYTQIN